jgi:hypothetical protein
MYSASVHARPVRVCTLPVGDVVAHGRLNEGYEISIASSKINVLDLDAQLFGEIAGGLRPLRCVLDCADALIGKVH